MLFFNKTKTEPPFPQYEFADRLDKLIIDGMRAGMGASEIENILEQRVNTMRQRQAMFGFACRDRQHMSTYQPAWLLVSPLRSRRRRQRRRLAALVSAWRKLWPTKRDAADATSPHLLGRETLLLALDLSSRDGSFAGRQEKMVIVANDLSRKSAPRK
jgi:hypothetical protein